MQKDIHEVISSLQSDFDRMTEAWINGYRLLGGKTFCSDRCSKCCTLAVNCSWGESIAVASSVSDRLIPPLREHVRKLKTVLAQCADFTSFLRMHRTEIGSCPFLADGSCSVYQARPFSCRSLLATKESRWCGADFGAMTGGEKQAFVESLDRGVVAFPMHYVSATQEMGQQLEARAAEIMAERYGFSVYGNMPLLVLLNREQGFADTLYKGYADTLAFLERNGLDHPFLVSLTVSTHKKETEDAGL